MRFSPFFLNQGSNIAGCLLLFKANAFIYSLDKVDLMRYFLDVTLKLEAEAIQLLYLMPKPRTAAIYLKTTDPLNRFRGSFRMPLQQREQVAASQRISLSGKLRKFEQKPELNKDRLRIHA